MEKPVELRDQKTGMLEIKKIVDCLSKNGYEFEGTRKAVVYVGDPNEFIQGIIDSTKNNVVKEELAKLDHYNHAVRCANRIYNSAFFSFLSYSNLKRSAISSNSAIFL